MPPKAKRGGDDGGDAVPKGAVTENMVQFLNLQIKNLKSKLEEKTAVAEALTTDLRQLRSESEEQRSSNRDIIEFLKAQLEEKEESLRLEKDASLKFREQKYDMEKDAEEKLRKKVLQFTARETEMKAEVERLRGELDEVNEYRLRKADHEAELEAFKVAKEQERERHKDRVHQLERELVMEKDRLKDETERRIQDNRMELMDAARTQLGTATQRTIVENEQLTRELAVQSKRSGDLLAENNELLERNRDMFRNLDMLAQMEEELTRKNQLHIKNLALAKEEEENLRGELKNLDRRKGEEIAQLKSRFEDARRLQEEAEAATAQAKANLANLTSELSRYKVQMSVDTKTVQELSGFISSVSHLEGLPGPTGHEVSTSDWVSLLNKQLRAMLLKGALGKAGFESTDSLVGRKLLSTSTRLMNLPSTPRVIASTPRGGTHSESGSPQDRPETPSAAVAEDGGLLFTPENSPFAKTGGVVKSSSFVANAYADMSQSYDHLTGLPIPENVGGGIENVGGRMERPYSSRPYSANSVIASVVAEEKTTRDFGTQTSASATLDQLNRAMRPPPAMERLEKRQSSELSSPERKTSGRSPRVLSGGSQGSRLLSGGSHSSAQDRPFLPKV